MQNKMSLVVRAASPAFAILLPAIYSIHWNQPPSAFQQDNIGTYGRLDNPAVASQQDTCFSKRICCLSTEKLSQREYVGAWWQSTDRILTKINIAWETRRSLKDRSRLLKQKINQARQQNRQAVQEEGKKS
jgi:hypothetical protein